MTIAAELLRLAAIEALSPTAAILAETGFPTLVRGNVFDSRRATLDTLDRDRDFTPVLCVFTRKSESPRRGQGQGSVSRFGRTTLEIVAELAVAGTDDDGSQFVDALAGNDPQARIVLSTLCAQVRHVLTIGPSGAIFRKISMAIDGFEEEGFAVPELGLRWQRTTMLLDCQIPDDDFSTSGGLPEPAATMAGLFPEGSYATGMLDRIGESFAAAPTLPVIQTIAFEVKQTGVSGQAGKADAVAPPFADIEE